MVGCYLTVLMLFSSYVWLSKSKFWIRLIYLSIVNFGNKTSFWFHRIWRHPGLFPVSPWAVVVPAAAAACQQDLCVGVFVFSLLWHSVLHHHAHVPGKAHLWGWHKDWFAHLHVQGTKYPRAARKKLHPRTRASGN